MKKRTTFETNLVRRIAKKNDYLRYIAYEMSLEALRKKRVERLSKRSPVTLRPSTKACILAELPRTTPSVSDYALVRRQFHVFERALKKFKSDVGLWIQYIELAKKEEARSLVGRICARSVRLRVLHTFIVTILQRVATTSECPRSLHSSCVTRTHTSIAFCCTDAFAARYPSKRRQRRDVDRVLEDGAWFRGEYAKALECLGHRSEQKGERQGTRRLRQRDERRRS